MCWINNATSFKLAEAQQRRPETGWLCIMKYTTVRRKASPSGCRAAAYEIRACGYTICRMLCAAVTMHRECSRLQYAASFHFAPRLQCPHAGALVVKFLSMDQLGAEHRHGDVCFSRTIVPPCILWVLAWQKETHDTFPEAAGWNLYMPVPDAHPDVWRSRGEDAALFETAA